MPKVLPPGEKVFLIEDVKDVCKAYKDAQKKPKFIIFSSHMHRSDDIGLAVWTRDAHRIDALNRWCL